MARRFSLGDELDEPGQVPSPFVQTPPPVSAPPKFKFPEPIVECYGGWVPLSVHERFEAQPLPWWLRILELGGDHRYGRWMKEHPEG